MSKEFLNSLFVLHFFSYSLLFAETGYTEDTTQCKSDMESTISAFRTKLSTIKTIGIVPIDFDCYNLTAGGIREYDDQMSCVARTIILNKVQAELSSKTLNYLGNDTSLLKEWKNVQRFYNAIHNSIEFNLSGQYAFLKPRDLLTFVMPPMQDLFSKSKIDAVLFIEGYDDKSTDRRSRLKAGAIAGAIAGSIMAAVIGVGGFTTIPDDNTVINSAIVNENGELYWYNTYKESGSLEMTNQDNVEAVIARLFEGFTKDTK